jgi:hypothetical protein
MLTVVIDNAYLKLVSSSTFGAKDFKYLILLSGSNCEIIMNFVYVDY